MRSVAVRLSQVLPQSGLANAPVKQSGGGTGTRRLRLEPGPQSGQGFLTESELECRAAVGTSPDHRVHRQQIWLGSHRLPPLAEHQRLAVQLARRAWQRRERAVEQELVAAEPALTERPAAPVRTEFSVPAHVDRARSGEY